jgi:transporter family protein
MNWVTYAVLSAASAGIIPILAKRGLTHVDSTLATALRALVMAASLCIAAGVLGRFRQLSNVDRPAVIVLLLTGFAGATSWFFYFLALKSGPATKVAVIDRTSVAFTLVLAALLLGEAMTWRTVLGVALIITGALLTLKG